VTGPQDRSREDDAARGAALLEETRRRLRAVPREERATEPNPKFADPIGVHHDGRPLPGYEPPAP
jgi:hypothetical protein